MTSEVDISYLALKYNTAEKRFLLFNHDVLFSSPEIERQSRSASKYLNELILMLASDRKNHVMVISARDKENLESSWSHVPIILVAENGGYYRNPGNSWHSFFSYNTEWISRTLSPLNALCFQYEGSFVEPRSHSLVWHYESLATAISEGERQQILSAIKSLPDHDSFTIYLDDSSIELRTKGIERDSFVRRWIGSRQYDFIMTFGRGGQDEGIFKIMEDKAATIRIGPSAYSYAKFHVNRQTDVVPLLQKLLQVNYEFEKSATKIGIQNKL